MTARKPTTAHPTIQSKPVSSKPSVPTKQLGERLLDEAYDAVRDYLSVTDAQAVAMVLYAAATNVIDAFPAFPRLLMSGEGPSCGKTQAMLTTAYMSQRPVNTRGSSYAVTSKLAEITNQPELQKPCFYRDEISSIYGRSGLNAGSKDPLHVVMQEGYKRGATTSWSVNRVSVDIGIYVAVIIAGNGTAVPTDIRSRCIVINMKRGRPSLDLDDDGSERRLRDIGLAMGAEVKRHQAEMIGYRCAGMVPKLEGRLHQVWRPLIAVAKYVGGPRWQKAALNAFTELNGGGTDSVILSPDQAILKSLVSVVETLELKPTDFIGGIALAEELENLESFEGRPITGICKDIARAMTTKPVQPRRPGHPRVWGHYVRDILAAWEVMRPVAPEEVSPLETDDNPYS
jgi:hypothetical protein